MTEDRETEMAIDRALDALGAAPPALPPGLRAAVLRDADAVQASFVRPVAVARSPQSSAWSGLWAALGGARGGAALVGAALAGIAIGLADIGPVASLTDAWYATEVESPFGGYDMFLEEDI